MPAVKDVQVVLLADRGFPVFSAKGADLGFEEVFACLTALNPAIQPDSAMLAIWEEGLYATLAKARRRQMPKRLERFKVVTPPAKKPNPRPTR